jgi:hypothetical protein
MRLFLQYGTLFIVIFLVLVMFAMVWLRDIKWRYSILPVLLMFQVIAFYLWVFIAKPPGIGFVQDWSALLRLTEWLGFAIVVLVYWHSKRPFTALIMRKIKHVVSKLRTRLPHVFNR